MKNFLLFLLLVFIIAGLVYLYLPSNMNVTRKGTMVTVKRGELKVGFKVKGRIKKKYRLMPLEEKKMPAPLNYYSVMLLTVPATQKIDLYGETDSCGAALPGQKIYKIICEDPVVERKLKRLRNEALAGEKIIIILEGELLQKITHLYRGDPVEVNKVSCSPDSLIEENILLRSFSVGGKKETVTTNKKSKKEKKEVQEEKKRSPIKEDIFVSDLRRYNNFINKKINVHYFGDMYSPEEKSQIRKCDFRSKESIFRVKRIINSKRLKLQKDLNRLKSLNIKNERLYQIHKKIITSFQLLLDSINRVLTTIGSKRLSNYQIALKEGEKRMEKVRVYVREYGDICRGNGIKNPALWIE